MIHHGKGVACMFYPIGFTEYPNPSSAFMKIDVDGSATLYCGATDIGQGSSTALIQVASETTGISIDKIRLVCADTKYAPYDTGSVASRVTLMAGNAVLRAATECRDQLFKAAVAKWGLIVGDPEQTLKVEKDTIYMDGFREYTMSIAEAAHFSCLKMGKPVIGKGSFNSVTMTLRKDNGHGKPYGTHVFASQIACVTVDDETGWYSIDKIYAVHDCGKALNPMLLNGQIYGGVGMGIGFASTEKLEMNGSKVANDQFTNYILPTSLDTPDIVPGFIERYDPVGAYGAKGIAEPSLLPTASAICNAIFDAVGVMITDLPITPEKVYMALQEKKAKEAAAK